MKSFHHLNYLILLLLLFGVKTHSQNIKLLLKTNDSTKIELLNSISYKIIHKTKKSVLKEVDRISNNITRNGYISNTYHITNKDSIYNALFTFNSKIDSIRINHPLNQLDKKLVKKLSAKFSDTFFDSSTKDIESTLKQIITFYEKNGASFTNCTLTNIHIINNKLQANLKLNISSYRKVNTILIKGYNEFPTKHITKHLNINKETPFTLNTLKTIDYLLNNISFVTQLKKPEVLFTKDSTTIYLYLKKKPISQIDGLIGFATKEDSNKLNFSGYLNLALNNIFNKGESFLLHWKNNGEKTQRLRFNISTPFIFNTKFDISHDFSILKQDSTYTNTTSLLNLKYHLNQKNSISTILNQETSNLNSTRLNTDELNSFKNIFYGISYKYESQKSLINFSASGSYLTGKRKNNITNEKQEKIEISTAFDFNLTNKTSIHFTNTSKFLNSKTLLQNELYRIGGINSIRGFDEESIYTPKYNISRLETQLKTSQSSHLYSITDYAIFKSPLGNSTKNNYSLGFGYFNLSEKNSIDLSYAFGNEVGKSFLLRNSKLHVRIKYFF